MFIPQDGRSQRSDQVRHVHLKSQVKTHKFQFYFSQASYVQSVDKYSVKSSHFMNAVVFTNREDQNSQILSLWANVSWMSHTSQKQRTPF